MKKQRAAPKFKHLFRYAESKEYIFIFIGVIFSILSGASKPIMITILSSAFGEVLHYPENKETMHNADEMFDKNIVKLCLDFVYLSIFSFIASYIHMVCWLYSGEMISLKVTDSSSSGIHE